MMDYSATKCLKLVALCSTPIIRYNFIKCFLISSLKSPTLIYARLKSFWNQKKTIRPKTRISVVHPFLSKIYSKHFHYHLLLSLLFNSNTETFNGNNKCMRDIIIVPVQKSINIGFLLLLFLSVY